MEHPLTMTYGPFSGWLLLILLGGISGSFFMYQVVKASRLVLKGSSDNRFDNWGARIKEVITGWLGQKKVLKDRVAGGIHVLMFWGFLMLSTDMFDLATANWFSHNLLPAIVKGPWNLMVETGYTLALVGCMAQIQKEKLLQWPNVKWVIGNAQKAHLATIIRDEEDDQPVVITPKMDKTPFTIEGRSRDKKHTRANSKFQEGCYS